MDQNSLLVALVVLIVILIICFAYRKYSSECGQRGRKKHGSHKSKFCSDPSQANDVAPWVVPSEQQKDIRAVKGHPDAERILNSLHEARQRGAAVAPEALMMAERELHLAATKEGGAQDFNTEHMTSHGDDVLQVHSTAPPLDYQAMVTDMVADPRMRDNQYKWAHAMKGYGATTIKADDLHPEDYLHHQGLRFPQAGVGQCNPLQLTEIDDSHLARNAPFNFRG